MSRTHKDTKKGKKKLAEKEGNHYCWFQYGGIPSWWKRMRKRIQRAKEKNALRRGEEPSRFRNDDAWDWW